MIVLKRWLARLVALSLTGALFFGIGYAIAGLLCGAVFASIAVVAALPYVLMIDWKE